MEDRCEFEDYYADMTEGIESKIETSIGDFTFNLKNGLLYYKQPAFGVMEYREFFPEDESQVIFYNQYVSGESLEVSINFVKKGYNHYVYLLIENKGETEPISDFEARKIRELLASNEASYIIKNYQR